MLIHYWDPEQEKFIIDHMPLHIDMEYIYFITRLSRRGEEVDLKGKAHGGLNIVVYYTSYTNKVGSQVLIIEITSFPIKIILFTIARVLGSTSLHQVS